MVQIAGKYTFVSEENFEDFLKAIGVENIPATHEIDVAVDGDNYTITNHTALKNVEISFTLGQEYEADPGTDVKAKYITTLDGNTLVTKEVENESNYKTREFTDDGLIITLHSKGVTATRHFKRA